MSSSASQKRTLETLLERHGRTYSHEAGISLGDGTPAPLFQLLCVATLLSARIRAEAAVSAARALFEEGLTTVDKMNASTWEERTRILNRSGYARYDESTSRMLGDTAQLLSNRYGGDLRNLREAAERDPSRERKLLKECKGIGDVGVNIFFREVQGVWDEIHPFTDEKVLEASRDLQLPTNPDDLAKLVKTSEFPVLVAALVRSRLASDAEELLAAASG